MLKKIISILILCALLAASMLVATGEKANETPYVPAGASGGVFDFEVLKQLYADGENTVFSPFAVIPQLIVAPLCIDEFGAEFSADKRLTF